MREKDELDKERRKGGRGRERGERVGSRFEDQECARAMRDTMLRCAPSFSSEARDVSRVSEAPILVRNPRRVIRSTGPR